MVCKEIVTMTVDKDRKRIIRDRMKKTGESYTAARVQILSKRKPSTGRLLLRPLTSRSSPA